MGISFLVLLTWRIKPRATGENKGEPSREQQYVEGIPGNSKPGTENRRKHSKRKQPDWCMDHNHGGSRHIEDIQIIVLVSAWKTVFRGPLHLGLCLPGRKTEQGWRQGKKFGRVLCPPTFYTFNYNSTVLLLVWVSKVKKIFILFFFKSINKIISLLLQYLLILTKDTSFFHCGR